MSEIKPSEPVHSEALAVDIPEAAAMLRVSTKTIRREIAGGRLRALRISRVWRIRFAELQAYLVRCQHSV